MQRLLFVLVTPCFVLGSVLAQEETPIPKTFQKQMDKMVGAWTFQGSEGSRKFSGAETIRLTNNKTALLQEGYFDLGGGKKEHYVILSGWDSSKKTMLVRGFTSDGYTWTGEWKELDQNKWIGSASGGKATFEVKAGSMRYEDAGDGTPWISEFTRKKQ